MDWGIIGTALAVVFSVTTIILAIKLAKRKKPVWAYVTTRIIGLGSDAPPELKLTFNDKPIADAYRTTLIFFNKGNEAIRKNDVTESVRIHFDGAKILREPIITIPSKDVIKFEAKLVYGQERNSIQLDFLYLDYNDGAIIEVLHTKCNEIKCEGDIIGVKQIQNIGSFEPFRARPVIFRLAASFALVACFVPLLVIDSLESFNFELDATIKGVMYFLIGFSLSQLPSDIRRCIRHISLPKWSRVSRQTKL